MTSKTEVRELFHKLMTLMLKNPYLVWLLHRGLFKV